VNSLAALREAAYLADGSIEDLKAQQVVLVQSILREKDRREPSVRTECRHAAVLRSQPRGVPLGFAILMNSRGASALDLLGEAMRIPRREVCRRGRAETPQAFSFIS